MCLLNSVFGILRFTMLGHHQQSKPFFRWSSTCKLKMLQFMTLDAITAVGVADFRLPMMNNYDHPCSRTSASNCSHREHSLTQLL